LITHGQVFSRKDFFTKHNASAKYFMVIKEKLEEAADPR
jgi:hypothetical protein